MLSYAYSLEVGGRSRPSRRGAMKHFAHLMGVDTPRSQHHVLRVPSRHAISLLLDLTHLYSVAILLHLV